MSDREEKLKAREVGETFSFRPWADQNAWLERMEAERSVSPSALMRAALDAYIPVFEALGDSGEAKRRRALDRVREVMECVGPDRVIAALNTLEVGAIEAAGAKAAEEGEAA
jgi:hypothetical protein